MDRKLLKKFEIAGAVFTLLVGIILHFAYELTGGAMWTLLFASVNESVWEHVKIFTMPYFVWGVVEFCVCKTYFKRFFVAKIVGLWFLGAVTIGFFYIYSLFLGKTVLIIDILSIVVWIILAHMLSYKLYMSSKPIEVWFSPALFMLVLYASMYFSFTACPPEAEIFRDPITGRYGIIPDNIDTGAFMLDIDTGKITI